MDTEIKYFTYTRKSSEGEERQVLSLDSQRDEARKRFDKLTTTELPPESKSAFKPYQRPIFSDMIERIEKGEVQGIIAWHPDRLARNPIDAAQIIYLLDIGKLKDLKFCSYYFENSPEGKMMLQIILSQSKYSSDKLGKDVKRGLEKKVEMGWYPSRAPLGYKNSERDEDKGRNWILKDPEKFEQVRQMWQMMLTGNYSVAEILRIVNEEWKFKTRPTKRHAGVKPLSRSNLYKIFTSPFYYGVFEYGKPKQQYRGKHDPMITEEEYWRVQELLGRKGRQRPKNHREFEFTGMMRCGHCGASVTAELKQKRYKNGTERIYIYYRCTKRKDTECPEKYIELAELNRQVDEIISTLTISEKFKNWALKYLHELRSTEAASQRETFAGKQKQLERIVEQLQSLTLRYAAPENAQNAFISSDEYQTIKNTLLRDKASVESDLKVQGRAVEEWVELSERTFNFVRYARIWFKNGDRKTRRAIFSALGSNLILTNKMVAIQLHPVFKTISNNLIRIESELENVRTSESTADKRQIAQVWVVCPTLRRR